MGAVRGKAPERSLGQILRELPYWRLIRADVLYIALVVTGTILLVVPGLIVATVFSIVGPVMLLEDRAVLDTFRRTDHLVRHNFWRVVLTTLVPLLTESAIGDRLLNPSSHQSLVERLVVECVFTVLVTSFIGLLEVQTAYQLIELDPSVGNTRPTTRPVPRPGSRVRRASQRCPLRYEPSESGLPSLAAAPSTMRRGSRRRRQAGPNPTSRGERSWTWRSRRNSAGKSAATGATRSRGGHPTPHPRTVHRMSCSSCSTTSGSRSSAATGPRSPPP